MTESTENLGEVYSADELGQYQAISPAALLALLLGLISPVAFLSPVLLMAPLAAIVVAIVALSRINAPQSGLSGAGLARAGLALAIIFGVASCSRLVALKVLESRQVEETASLFQPFGVLEGTPGRLLDERLASRSGI